MAGEPVFYEDDAMLVAELMKDPEFLKLKPAEIADLLAKLKAKRRKA